MFWSTWFVRHNFLPFWLILSRFWSEGIHLSQNKDHIWNQHKKLSGAMYVSHLFENFFYRRKIHPYSPLRIRQKMKSVKVPFSTVYSLTFCVLVAIYKFVTPFPLSKWLFDWSRFWRIPGGSRGEFFDKKKFLEKMRNIHCSTQLFMLILNSLYLDSNVLLLTRIDQVSVKKARNYASRIMCSKKFLVANVL
jgi:hypothetical protein